MTPLEETRSEAKRPPDFTQFWRHLKDELAQTPFEWERIPDATWTTPELTVDWLRFPSLGGQIVYGWLAVPRDAALQGNVGYLWLPGYSHGSPPPRAESLYPGTVTLGLNLHGSTPDTPYIHPGTLNREYITQGIDSPETYVYRDIVAHCLRAFDVLGAQPEVSPARRVVGGMSQGGGLALVTAALAPQARMCFADMPWLCDLDRALSLIDRARYKALPHFRIPDGRALIEDYADAHPDRREQIFQTFRYFDPLSHAADVRCPTQVSAGGRDPSCKPPTIYAVYNALTCEKEMLYLPTVGHEIVPAMHDAHARWVQRLHSDRTRSQTMNNEQPDTIEDHIGLTQPDAAEQTTSSTSVTGKHLFIDGGDGKEKEATIRSHHAGASSEAPASSGIPSAMTQAGIPGQTVHQEETPMGNRDIPTRQDIEP